jgi:nitrite reductase/ring-hydroxylating ferredoxin subunit
MIEVGELVREVGAGLERVIEDELDWEHLAFVHASTFRSAELISGDRRGFEAAVVLFDGTPMTMRVVLDEDGQGYVNSTFDPDGAENGRTVCRIDPLGEDAARMRLRFFTPDHAGLDAAAVGAFYVGLWNRLIDEDEPKMIHRAAALRAGAQAHQARRDAVLADGSIVRVPLVCPHQGLPLEGEPDADGVMTCPWHGYQFDARTGRCLRGRIKGWLSA